MTKNDNTSFFKRTSLQKTFSEDGALDKHLSYFLHTEIHKND